MILKMHKKYQDYTGILDFLPQTVFEIDPEGFIKFINRYGLRTFGYSEEDVRKGLTISQFVIPKDRAKLTNNIRGILNGGGVKGNEYTELRSNGSTFSSTVYLAPIIKKRQTVGLTGIVIDNTERKQTEEALKAAERNFRNTLDNSPLGVIIYNDRTVKVLYANQAALDIFGYTSVDDFNRIPRKERYTPESYLKVEELIDRRRRGLSMPTHFERDVVRKNGEIIHVEASESYVLWDGQRQVQIFYRDTTERKRAEREIIKSRKRIVETQELLRKEMAQELHGTVQNKLIVLITQLKRLEENSVKDNLVTEIKNIRKELEDVVETHVNRIGQQLFPSILRRGIIPALQSLTDQFIGILNIETQLDEKLYDQEKVTPGFIAEQVKLALYRIAEESLINIVKHTKTTQALIKLVWYPDKEIHLKVSDDGQGFDTNITPSGIGLVLMQDYAKVLGGDCDINSSPNNGTQVIVSIPLQAKAKV